MYQIAFGKWFVHRLNVPSPLSCRSDSRIVRMGTVGPSPGNTVAQAESAQPGPWPHPLNARFRGPNAENSPSRQSSCVHAASL